MKFLKRRKDKIKKRETIKKKLLFKDLPKKHLSEDRFKHDIYVKTLEEILIKSETPINIGVFGKWGVGKTTIINFLKKQIENNKLLKDKIKFIKPFDMWKYSGDSFRRQLLLHLNEALPKHKRLKNIEDKLYAITEEKKDTKLKISIKNIIYIGIILIFIILSLAASFNYKGKANTILQLIVIPLFLLLIRSMENVLRTISVKKILPRMESPEEFEKLFDNVIKRIKSEKVVITLDNLDRCKQNIVVNTLGTIKTFLEKPKCIFIIPCDDEAIKNYINRTRGTNIEKFRQNEDGEEFLRKFFQASIRTPIYLDETLENYMKEIFNEIELADNIDDNLKKRIMQVIMSAYTKNPRRIKRFLNNLSTLWILAKEKEKNKLLNPGIVTKNLDFLSKLAIIYEDWNNFYKYIERDYQALNNIETFFQGRGIDNKKEEKIKEFLNENNNPGLKSFLIATRSIGYNIRNIRPFMTLHQETYQATITELEEFQIRLRDGDQEYFVNIFDKLSNKEKESYEKEVMGMIKTYFNQGYFNYVFNIIYVILTIYGKLISKEPIVGITSNILATSEFMNFLPKFDIDSLFNLLRNSPINYRNTILRNFFNMSQRVEYKEIVLNSLISNSNLLPSDLINELNSLIIKDYEKNNDETLPYIEKIVTIKDAKKRIINSKMIGNIVDSIIETETDKNNRKVKLYLELKDKATVDTNSNFVNKMINIIQSSSSNVFDPRKSYGFENIQKLESKDIPNEISENLVKCFKTQYTQIQNPRDQLIIIKTILKLIDAFSKEKKKDLIINCIINFIKTQDSNNIYQLMEILKE